MSSDNNRFDVIVVGGGIYGVMIALEASLRNLSVAIVERKDWGCGTTFNWLRILHGGLRYLQTVDLPRFYESVRERGWFLEHFPDLVKPLPCIMPLYETNSYSTMLMRVALGLNDVLSLHRNRHLLKTHHILPGEIINIDAVQEALPFVDGDGLRAGARWYDAIAVEPQRLLLELVQWCKTNGVRAFNYTEAVDLLNSDGGVTGLEVRGAGGGARRQMYAPVVINATGHWCIELATRFGLSVAKPPRMSWAWNILFDVPNNSCCAGAVTARRRDGQTFFVLPWQGRTLVGTGHAAIPEGAESSSVPGHLIQEFISQVNEAAPALDLTEARISRVFEGRLPVQASDVTRLTSRPLIVDHGSEGVEGFYTVWGIKYTTARPVARALLRKACSSNSSAARHYTRPTDDTVTGVADEALIRAIDNGTVDELLLRNIVKMGVDSDVHCLDDLLLRRCGLGDHPDHAMRISRQVAELMPWSDERQRIELQKFAESARCSRRGTD
jgi:glycerol-3-phosphate dehydrogenase